MDRPDIAHSIRRANQDIAKPKVRTEARLKRFAHHLLCEPGLIWTFPYQEMSTTLVVRTDANSTGQDNRRSKVFQLCGSMFHAMTSGGAHGIHTKKIFNDFQVEIVLVETDSTSASGICRRRGVGRLRHLDKKELWLQDQVAAKNVELGRVPSEVNEEDLHTFYLERYRVNECGQRWECCLQGFGLENNCLWFRALK